MKRKIITIDNGGSELRFIESYPGSNSTASNFVVKTMDKNIIRIPDGNFRLKDTIEKLDVIHIQSAPKSEYVGMYATGNGFYMYDGTIVEMTNQEKKANSLSWYIQIIIALATAAMSETFADDGVLRVENEGETEVTVNNEYEYIMSVLLPVLEHSGKTDYASVVKANLTGTYVVSFPALKDCSTNTVKFTIDKDKIGVLPEGTVAMTSLRNEVGPNDTTLIIDMGHVTTDISSCRGTKLIGSAVVSSPFAGNTLLNLIMSIIRSHGVPSTTQEMCIEALTTNKFRIGTREIDISEEMENVKDIFVSNYVKGEILNQIELSGLTATSIQYVVPVGAVLGTKHPTNKRYDILERIITEVGLKNAEVKIVSDKLRNVNIENAAIFCEAFAKRF